jgi:hypothetical protein
MQATRATAKLAISVAGQRDPACSGMREVAARRAVSGLDEIFSLFPPAQVD